MMRVVRGVAWFVAIGAGVVGCAGPRGGGGTRASDAPGRVAAAPLEDVVPVWPGTSLVLGWSGESRRIAAGVAVKGSDGSVMQSTLWRVWVRPGGVSWSGAVAAWDAEMVDAEDEGSLERARQALSSGVVDGARSWLMVSVEVPAGFFGEWIDVDGRRVGVSASPGLVEAAWVSPVPVYADWAVLLDAAEADEASPMLRWRSRLLRAGVPGDPSRPVGRLASPVLESLAVQEELRWRAGLSRLYGADEGLAARVKRRLLPMVESSEAGLTVPLWTQETRAIEELAGILGDERGGEASLVSRVEGWLRRQPEAAVWFEHAFAQDAAGSPTGWVRAWAGNVSGREVMAWMEFVAERPIGAPVAEPVLLAPGELRLLEAPVVIGEGGERSVSVEVHVGARVERGEVVVGAAGVEPPGMVLGPLVAVHDAGSVLGGESAEVEGGTSRATLRRVDGVGSAGSAAAGRGRWSVLVECGAEEGRGPGVVALDFAHEGGRTVVEVDGIGGVRVEAPAGLPVTGYPRVAPVVERGGVWAAEVPVPDWCVGLDGRLRVSVLRVGEGGGVWSWPTRALRFAPLRGGRAVLDLGAWDRE